MATRRRPGVLPPKLTPERQKFVIKYHYIAVKLTAYYFAKRPANLIESDLFGEAEEALSIALATADLANPGLEHYLWESVRGALKDLVRKTAIEHGGTPRRSTDAPTDHLLQKASAALSKFAGELPDPGSVWDTREESIQKLDEVVGDSVTVLTLGSGAALWAIQGDEGMVLRVDLVRAMKAVRALVSELPPVLRTVVELRFYKSCELEDVAKRAGMTLPTVNRRLTKALKLLRARLVAKGITGLPE